MEIAETGDFEDVDLEVGVFYKIKDRLDLIFGEKPNIDWVAIGIDTETIYFDGSDQQLPTMQIFRQWQEIAGEQIEIFGRTVEIF